MPGQSIYAKPWTIVYPLKKQQDELLEDACLEDNQDLQHLNAVKGVDGR